MESIQVFNPATGEAFAQVPRLDAAAAGAAVEAAEKASTVVRKLPLAKRAGILKKTVELMAQKQEELARTLTMEIGKPIRDSRVEVVRAMNVLTYCAEECKNVLEGAVPRVDGYEYPVGNENRIVMLTREPIGVVLAITPFNFPSNSFAHKVGPAFVAGNSVVVKPSQAAPLSAIKLVELMLRAGAPAGAVGAVTGYSREIGDALVDDPSVGLVTFTGSTKVGLSLAARAATHGKRTIMELGGSDAAIFREDVDLEAAVKAAVRGRFDYAGQNCNSTKRLLVHAAIAEKFTRMFVEQTRLLKVGDPMDEATDVGPVINADALEFAEKVTADATERGARLLYGGERAPGKGHYLKPTVLGGVPEGSLALSDEVFAPVAPIASYSSDEDAVRIANSTPYGLQAAVFTRDLKRALQMSKDIRAGTVLINDSTRLRWDALPFGGVKSSGFGREGVRESMLEMTEPKITSMNLSD